MYFKVFRNSSTKNTKAPGMKLNRANLLMVKGEKKMILLMIKVYGYNFYF